MLTHDLLCGLVQEAALLLALLFLLRSWLDGLMSQNDLGGPR